MYDMLCIYTLPTQFGREVFSSPPSLLLSISKSPSKIPTYIFTQRSQLVTVGSCQVYVGRNRLKVILMSVYTCTLLYMHTVSFFLSSLHVRDSFSPLSPPFWTLLAPHLHTTIGTSCTYIQPQSGKLPGS